mgnify:CR=1 FL=1
MTTTTTTPTDLEVAALDRALTTVSDFLQAHFESEETLQARYVDIIENGGAEMGDDAFMEATDAASKAATDVQITRMNIARLRRFLIDGEFWGANPRKAAQQS